MLPNATLDGLGMSDVLVAPEPCTPKEILPFTTTLPPAEPNIVGRKVILTDKLCPGAIFNGRAGWLVL